jgi:hypothetical protein
MNIMLAVTFAWSLPVACFTIYYLFRCKHSWSVLTDRDFDPAGKIVKDLGFTFKDGVVPGPWFKRTYFAIVKCDKCGAIKEYKVEVTCTD